MSKGTAHRTIRIDDDLWNAAKEVAAVRVDHLSQVIREALREYVEKEAGNE